MTRSADERDRLDEAALHSAVELLASSAGLHPEPSEVRAAAYRGRSVRDGGWQEVLRTASEAVGVDLRPMRRALSEVVAGVPELPIFTSAGADWFAVLQADGARLQIVSSRADGAAWMAPSELAEALGVTLDTPVDWGFAVPSAPMEAVRSSGAVPSPAARLRKLLRLERRDLWIIVIYAAGVGTVSLVMPVAVQTLVTNLAFGTLMQPIVVLMVLLAGALVFAGAMRSLEFVMVEVLRQRVFARTAVDVAYRMPRVSLERFERGTPPELVNRFFDVVTVQKATASLLMDGLGIALQTIIGMLVLGFYHPLLLAFDMALLAGVIFVLVVLGRGATKASLGLSKAKYAVAAWLEETARHVLLFKSPGSARYASERASDLVRGYLLKRRKRFTIVLRQFVGALGLQVTAFTALLGIGGWLVIERQLTIGQLIAAEIIVTSVVDGLTKLGKHLETYYDLLAAVDKLGELVDLPLERSDGSPKRDGEGPASLRLRDLRYEVGGAKVLDGISLTVASGSRVGIVGAEASGKTVLADLLYELRTPSRGGIEIDGVDTRELSLEALRRELAMAKDVEIFEGTISENVTCGRHDLDEDDVRAALLAVGLAGSIERLPGGVATRLTSSGAPLSSVQMLRLMLARLVAGAPRLVVVDGLLDGLRGVALDQALEALRRPDAPWTLVVLTCDADIARRMDTVHVLERGQLSLAKEVAS